MKILTAETQRRKVRKENAGLGVNLVLPRNYWSLLIVHYFIARGTSPNTRSKNIFHIPLESFPQKTQHRPLKVTACDKNC